MRAAIKIIKTQLAGLDQRSCVFFSVFFFTVFLINGPDIKAAQDDTYAKSLEIKQSMAKAAEKIAEDAVKAADIKAEKSPSVSVKIVIDSKAISKDRQAHQDAELENYKKEVQRIEDRQKQFLDSIKSDKAAGDKKDEKIDYSIVGKEKDFRLGILNIDLQDKDVAQILSRDTDVKEALQPSQNLYSIMMESPKRVVTEFDYDMTQYITDVSMSVLMPDAWPEAETLQLQESIFDSLNLADLTSKKANEIILVRKLQAPKVEKEIVKVEETWIEQFLSPRGNSLGSLLSALAIGLFVLLSAFFTSSKLSKIFNQVSESIATLKPESTIASSSETEIEEAKDADAGSENDSGFSGESLAQALTSDMTRVRELLVETVRDEPDIAAEIFRDLVTSESGLRKLRDLMAFTNYKALQPGLIKLGRDALDKFTTYIESSGGEGGNPLSGVEVAQSLYRDAIAKVTGMNPEHANAINRFRGEVVSISDSSLGKVAASCTADEIAFLVNNMSTIRRSVLVRSTPPELFAKACSMLDKVIPQMDAMVTAITDKIHSVTRDLVPSSGKRQRIVLQIVSNTTIEEEDKSNSLVPEDDWELRREMMKTKLFYRDLQFVEPDLLRSTFESLATREKGNFLGITTPEIKEIVLSNYEPGSKLREMIDEELKEIEIYAERAEEIKETKSKIINQFMARIRKQMTYKEVNKVIANKCKKLGLKLPESLAA